MKYVYILFFIILVHSSVAQIPIVTAGSLKRIENFQSRYVTARNVDIWLPDGYNNSKKYAVLYMHDGQMLYDSSDTWNGTTWDVDVVVSNLLKENKIRDVIVVGVWNDGKTRHKDYFPQKPFESLSQKEKDYVSAKLMESGRTTEYFQPASDDYLKFLVTELKPFIDKNYSTYRNRKSTFIAGSSMGGLISIYAICEYPDIFGGAACLSTHWPGIFTMDMNPVPDAFIKYLNSGLPKPGSHKIYFDYGDQTLDAMYPPLQKRVDDVMLKKGFSSSTWITKSFPGENHSEDAWRKRLPIPLLFLLSE